MIIHNQWAGIAEQIRRTNTVRGRAAASLYSVEGLRLIERALHAGAALEAVLMAESLATSPDARLAAMRRDLGERNVAVYLAPDAVVYDLTEGRDLGAILGLVRLPQAPTLAELLRRDDGHPALFLAGVDILDPGNAGALVRTAHAVGATAFLAAGTTDPFHPRATRISRGSIFRLPIVPYASSADLLAGLRAEAVQTIATAATRGALLPDLPPVVGAAAVLMGNEGEGLPDAVLSTVDTIVTIPMPEGVDSFAVNAAAAVVVYELRRHTWRGRSRPGDSKP